jgi:hypothetical protein
MIIPPNISVQAAPVYAFCEFLSQVPGAPDRGLYL